MAAPFRQPEEAVDDTEFIDDHHEHHRDSVHRRLRANSAIMQFQKILVANRGEIPIRIFRTAHELSLQTVAIYSYEDRLSMHRQKADEAYMIGRRGQYTPVAAYLAIDEIVKIAQEHGVHLIHPGYGFLSENAEFARKVEKAGIVFVGPTPETIDALGDKVSARQLAIKCGVPVVPGTPGPVERYEEVKAFTDTYGFPIIIKAAFGGGGRGMRVVRDQADLRDAFERATSEARSAFGNGTVFVERFLDRPKHIEVQLLGDNHGNVIHLFERDCSVQRRHQKVVEIAPAKDLPTDVRDRILADAVKLAKSVNYRNAGTAEFLVDQQNRYYFIEINPRIQVEHTITEEITGIDIVAAQIQIAAGATLEQLGLTQDRISTRGFAIQCRITTEDPANGFRPDTGKIEVYRSAGGNGVRLDGGNGFAGAIITPHYDSMLVKCTCRGSTYEIARRKVVRALVEFRIRGVKTNIPFLTSLLSHPTFIDGTCWTTFIDDTPELFALVGSQNRAQKLLAYLGDVAVNGSSIKGQIGEPKLKGDIIKPTLLDAAGKPIDVSVPCTHGWKQIIDREGPAAFAKAIRANKGCLIMDTTWRDAHQSLLATRVRTIDLLNIAKETSYAYANAYSLECWGGATFDVAMRFLYEDPWDRLRKLRKAVPNIPFQMLLRGANGVAYSSLPDNAIYHFCKQAKKCGVDIFRVFDALNDVDQLEVGIKAVQAAEGVVEATICYSGDMLNPKKKYNLEYYLALVDKIVQFNPHILGIKDMAGVLKPQAARLLVGSIRERYPDLPIHVHTHDSAGTGVASMVACAQAGADAVDAATDSMSGMTSQPSVGAILASLEGTEHDPKLNRAHVRAIDSYWQQLRLLYSPFEAGLTGPDPEVYEHEIPGGQLTNLLFQASQLGLGQQWAETKKAYEAANDLLGDIVKVTPTSKVVGDLAQFMVSNKLTPEDVIARAGELDFPGSVLEFLEGLMGQPFGGFPEPLRSKALRDRRKLDKRPGLYLEPLDLAKIKNQIREKYGSATEYDVASYAMYPKVFEDYKKFVQKFGDLSILPTRYFLAKPEIGEEFHVELEQGKVLILKLLAIGPLSEQTGQREVFYEVNGEVRQVTVDDNKASVDNTARPKADIGDSSQIGAPMSGVVVEIRVHEGSEVKKGDPVAVLSAMKMEMVISAPHSGKVSGLLVKEGDSVDGQDLICKIAKA
ncbi:pyruvate carboxylase [Aspergillus lentulus]|uniref:Pyruvate carboxylase n=1 Tax=Aspergillus lentulus TaxID=293939 RepID=A0AAN4PJM3_ASPLE|nr:pyruvate carboxylase [Aspergillus lentulus]GAQ07929.1 pyruvate carboxylase [Aspergillus lentulus]GFF25025.1 pyruvate carboxylase [Aspergillus lentulus]GFF53695.1 pyruvate carboxylase [Aspergillus lentulus]GFF65426.1 pyruvate carboxylase [Aspergillus lentulus]GFF68433.1 pyruvate carboxylase [Aspergillus lentulus]